MGDNELPGASGGRLVNSGNLEIGGGLRPMALRKSALAVEPAIIRPRGKQGYATSKHVLIFRLCVKLVVGETKSGFALPL